MPPPMPVSMPSSAAITGFRPKASAFCVPATAKSARPAASNIKIGVRSRSISEYQKKVSNPAARADRKIAPVADRGRRNRADQQIARDAAGAGRHEGQDQNAEEVEPAPDARHRAADREDKRAGKVEHQQKIVDRLPVRDRAISRNGARPAPTSRRWSVLHLASQASAPDDQRLDAGLQGRMNDGREDAGCD